MVRIIGGINASTVNLHHNKFTIFPKLLFEKESPMQTLNLSANGMTTIPKGALEGKDVFGVSH